MTQPGAHRPDTTPSSVRLDRGASGARRRRERRVWAWALVGSMAVHGIVALMLVHAPGPVVSAPPARPQPWVAVPAPGMRAVELVEVAGEDEPDEAEEPPSPAAEPRVPTRAGEASADETELAADAAPMDPADDRTAADRLAPRLVDPRLWDPVVVLPEDPTLDDVARRIGAALELVNDSALAEIERKTRITDWTFEDDEGGRWGISPGKLHLGKLTLPLPIWLPTSNELADRNREWLEFQAWSERAAIIESFEAQVQAIRERRERERAARRTAEDGGGGTGGSGGSGGR